MIPAVDAQLVAGRDDVPGQVGCPRDPAAEYEERRMHVERS
jgi:hypothetical protein